MTCMFMTSIDFQNQSFQRKRNFVKISSIFSFLTPQNALNISRSLTLVGHKLNTQSHVPNFTKLCLWCVQLASAWDTHKVICKQRITTLSTLFITYVWKWLSHKELHNVTITSPRKHACNHYFLFSFWYIHFDFDFFFF